MATTAAAPSANTRWDKRGPTFGWRMNAKRLITSSDQIIAPRTSEAISPANKNGRQSRSRNLAKRPSKSLLKYNTSTIVIPMSWPIPIWTTSSCAEKVPPEVSATLVHPATSATPTREIRR